MSSGSRDADRPPLTPARIDPPGERRRHGTISLFVARLAMEITEQNWPDVRRSLEGQDPEVLRLASTIMVGRYMIRQDTARKLMRKGRVPKNLVIKLRQQGV